MTRKSDTLAPQVERARLLALLAVYDAIATAGGEARRFFASAGVIKAEPADIQVSLDLLVELRNQAITLAALAPPVEHAPTATEQFANNFFNTLAESMIPGSSHTPGDMPALNIDPTDHT